MAICWRETTRCPSEPRREDTKVGVDQTYPLQTSWQHYREGGESTGGEKSGEVKTDLEKIRRNQSKDKGTDVGSVKENCSKLRLLAQSDCDPILHQGTYRDRHRQV